MKEFEKYLKDDINESLKKDLNVLDRRQYQLLKDGFYKVADGIVQLEEAFENISMSLPNEPSKELMKEYKNFEHIKKLMKQSKFHKIL